MGYAQHAGVNARTAEQGEHFENPGTDPFARHRYTDGVNECRPFDTADVRY